MYEAAAADDTFEGGGKMFVACFYVLSVSTVFTQTQFADYGRGRRNVGVNLVFFVFFFVTDLQGEDDDVSESMLVCNQVCTEMKLIPEALGFI